MKKSAKVLEVIGVVVLAVVISITGFMLIGPLFGWEAHKVLTGSMEPTFEVGGMIITKPVKLEDIKPGDHEERTGDIIAFRLKRGEKEEQITHRVVDVVVLEGKLWFQTWGDRNEEADPDLVSSEGDTIRKVYFHVPYLGFLAGFMETTLAFVVMMIIPGVILVVWFSRDLWKGISEEKKKREAETTTPEVAQDLGEEVSEQEKGEVEAITSENGGKKKRGGFPTIP